MFDSEGMEIPQASAILGDYVFPPVGWSLIFHFMSSAVTRLFFCQQGFLGILKCARQLGIANLQWFIALMWPSSMAKQLKLGMGASELKDG